jgi:hypothetical protein
MLNVLKSRQINIFNFETHCLNKYKYLSTYSMKQLSIHIYHVAAGCAQLHMVIELAH